MGILQPLKQHTAGHEQTTALAIPVVLPESDAAQLEGAMEEGIACGRLHVPELTYRGPVAVT